MSSIASSKLRPLLLLVLIGLTVFALDLGFGISEGVDSTKLTRLGRYAACLNFLAVYFCILSRIFLSGSKKIVKILISFLLIDLALIVSALVIYLSFSQVEILNLGIFSLSKTDFNNFIYAGVSLCPAMGLVMAITPVLIPVHQLTNLARLFGEDIHTGFSSYDQYLNLSKKEKEANAFPQVLILEDDLTSATTVLRFMSKLKLHSAHVETISEAISIFDKNFDHLKMIILDNFVRVESSPSAFKTGSDWLTHLNSTYPKETRHFSIVMMSGHTELISDNSGADLVLQKPWEPSELLKYMKEKGIIYSALKNKGAHR